MKVYVCQGHEKGIGLEVFLKTCLLLDQRSLALVELIAFEEPVIETLSSMGLAYSISDETLNFGGIELGVRWQTRTDLSQSFSALSVAMKEAQRGGILFTLPTSKDQFPGDAGHTEYFRRHFNKPSLGMFFSANDLKVLLITDHLAVHHLSNTLQEDFIYERTAEALESLRQWRWIVPRVFLAGLNPHAGENGLIGHEDERIKAVVQRLRSKYKIEVSGPWPGDTMIMEKRSAHDLLVYLYHDQGLGVFKGLQGFVGSNITLGLPFPRFSPDHGTSFSLFGKNQADYRGCAYALKEAIHLLKGFINGKDSGY